MTPANEKAYCKKLKHEYLVKNNELKVILEQSFDRYLTLHHAACSNVLSVIWQSHCSACENNVYGKRTTSTAISSNQLILKEMPFQ